MSSKLNCAQAREIDLVDYLGKLGYTAQKIRSGEYWYLSPLRVEKSPSFKVDRGRNIWYDHGLGLGGTLIDFGLQFHQCSLVELLCILSEAKEQSFSFQQPHLRSQKGQLAKETKLQILHSEPLQQPSLSAYILHRGISLQTAKRYLEQVSYRVNEKEFMALGFRNNSGGYELRSETFKGSSSPKDSTLVKGSKTTEILAVFEGIFSFLSYLELRENYATLVQKSRVEDDTVFEKMEANFLVLNSLSFLEKRRETMEHYSKINLYLDRDQAGAEATQKALHWSQRYTDRSSLFRGYKDFNDYLVHLKKLKQLLEPKKGKRQRRTI